MDLASLIYPDCAIKPWGFRTRDDAQRCAAKNASINGIVLGVIVLLVMLLMYFGGSSMATIVLLGALAGGAIYLGIEWKKYYVGQQFTMYDTRRKAYVLQGRSESDAFAQVSQEAEAEAQTAATRSVAASLLVNTRRS